MESRVYNMGLYQNKYLNVYISSHFLIWRVWGGCFLRLKINVSRIVSAVLKFFVQCDVHRCLSLSSFFIGHCVVWFSSIYGFWPPLRYLQALPTFFYLAVAIFLLRQYPNLSRFGPSYFKKHIINSRPQYHPVRFDQPILWLWGWVSGWWGVWGLRFDYMLFKVTRAKRERLGYWSSRNIARAR